MAETHKNNPNVLNAPYPKSYTCNICHKSYETKKEHKRFSIDCITCHNLNHSTKNIEKAKKDCISCHIKEKSQFNLPFSHRAECKDCHNPHKDEKYTPLFCTKCHIDKRGPFVYEHLPAKAGDCMLCHEPHGSPNPRQLRRQNIGFLCLECHIEVSSFHNPSQEVYQNCVLCHSEIHGSNKNKYFID